MIGMFYRVLWVLVLLAAGVGVWVIGTEFGVISIGLIAAPERWPRDGPDGSPLGGDDC